MINRLILSGTINRIKVEIKQWENNSWNEANFSIHYKEGKKTTYLYGKATDKRIIGILEKYNLEGKKVLVQGELVSYRHKEKQVWTQSIKVNQIELLDTATKDLDDLKQDTIQAEQNKDAEVNTITFENDDVLWD